MPLFADPAAPWGMRQMTTYKFNNNNNDEELYNEAADPNEWTNFAKDSQYNGTKAELAKVKPTTNHEPVGESGQKKEQKREKKKKAKEQK